tara:strand:- start:2712 stop:3845 length:1134 start_codon:yes stop_codon:yes gene_type:complete
MVSSDAFVQGFLSFADTYGGERRSYNDTLAREEANIEISRDRKVRLVNELMLNSPVMQQDLSLKQRESVGYKLADSSNINTLNQISDSQVQGAEVFNLGKTGVFPTGDGTFISISSLKPTKVTDADKTRNAFLEVVERLQKGGEGDSLAIYSELPNKLKLLARKEAEKNMTDHQGRVSIAQNEKWITVKEPMGSDPSELPTYSLNRVFIESDIGKKFFGGKVNADDPKAIRKLLYGPLVNQERAARYFRAFAGSKNARTAIRKAQDKGQILARVLENLDEQSIAETPSPGIGASSTDVLEPRAFSQLTNEWNENYFKGLIDTLDGTPRNVVIDGLANTITDKFERSKYIRTDRETALNFIREYIASQFDSAMSKSVQ